MKLASLAFVLLFGLALSASVSNLKGTKRAQKVYAEPYPSVMNFTNGLISGMEANANSPGKCADDLTGAEGNLADLVSAVASYINGDQNALFEILSTGSALIKAVEGSSTDCDFSALAAVFEGLSTAAGREAIIGNVMSHFGSIVSDAQALATCGSNLYTCGFNIGQIFHLVSGWSVNSSPFEHGYVSVPDFLQGFVQGVEVPDSNGKCITDVSSIEPLFTSIYQDAVDVINGDYFDVISLISDVKTAISDIEGFDGDCNVNGLVSVVESLGTTAGWVTVAENFMANFGTISTDAAAFLQCPSNPTQCGYSLGAILRMTLGWGLGSDSAIAPKKRVADSNFATWMQSFVNGLEAEPSSNNICANDLLGLSTGFESIYNDLISLSQGNSAALFSLISDAKTLLNNMESFSSPCNLPELESILANLATPGGVMELVNHVTKNWSALQADATNVQNCEANVALCGQSAGEIVQLVLGWGI